MTTKNSNRYGSYGDWLRSTLPSTGDAEYRTAGSSPVTLIQTTFEQVYPAPPLPDWVVQINLGEPRRLRCDLGHRPFEGLFSTGSFVLAPPGGACDFASLDAGFRVLNVTIPAARMRAVAELRGGLERVRTGSLHSRFHADPLVPLLARRMWDEAAAGSGWGDLFADHALDTLVVLLFRMGDGADAGGTAPVGRLSGRQLAAVVEYMDARLGGSVTLDDLAGIAHVSRFHFARLFKATTGVPPHQYLIARRVERAKELIRAGHLTLAQVASACGFSDHSRFTSHFKRLVGVTPKKFV